MPRSRARCTQAMALSLRGPFEKVSQEPKAISDTVSRLFPSGRYFKGAPLSRDVTQGRRSPAVRLRSWRRRERRLLQLLHQSIRQRTQAFAERLGNGGVALTGQRRCELAAADLS